ncbi:MAG: chemotaxis protein CheC [Chloroflexota bacterium]|nr:chemotaxis protein CheC [Chloroflexota bacterium]
MNRTRRNFDLASWSKLAHMGSTNAILGLSQMVNEEMQVTALDLQEVSLRNATSLMGKAEDVVVGIYLLFSGNGDGQIMLAFPPETAFELVDMLMAQTSGSTTELGDMERSALGEIGNIVGSFFLNAVADYAGLRLLPSPPAVVMDMAGAIIGSLMAPVFSSTESVFVIKMNFSTQSRQIEGRFLVLPTFDSTADTS